MAKKKHYIIVKNKVTGKTRKIESSKMPQFVDEWEIHSYDRSKENIEYLRKHGIIK